MTAPVFRQPLHWFSHHQNEKLTINTNLRIRSFFLVACHFHSDQCLHVAKHFFAALRFLLYLSLCLNGAELLFHCFLNCGLTIIRMTVQISEYLARILQTDIVLDTPTMSTISSMALCPAGCYKPNLELKGACKLCRVSSHSDQSFETTGQHRCTSS